MTFIWSFSLLWVNESFVCNLRLIFSKTKEFDLMWLKIKSTRKILLCTFNGKYHLQSLSSFTCLVHCRIMLIKEMYYTYFDYQNSTVPSRWFIVCGRSSCKISGETWLLEFNPLAPELFFLILAPPVYKMWVIQEPNELALWNKLHFEEEKTESIEHV